MFSFMQGMSRRVYPRTNIRAWRKQRGLTLEQLGARVEMSAGNLSRLERGLIPYDQRILEAVADALNTDTASLVMRNPPNHVERELFEVIKGATPEKKIEITRVIKALIG